MATSHEHGADSDNRRQPDADHAAANARLRLSGHDLLSLVAHRWRRPCDRAKASVCEFEKPRRYREPDGSVHAEPQRDLGCTVCKVRRVRAALIGFAVLAVAVCGEKGANRSEPRPSGTPASVFGETRLGDGHREIDVRFSSRGTALAGTLFV